MYFFLRASSLSRTLVMSVLLHYAYRAFSVYILNRANIDLATLDEIAEKVRNDHASVDQDVPFH